ncbi:MAG: hypothetical protein R3E48_00505 [Burkholderiaceae bacterium]
MPGTTVLGHLVARGAQARCDLQVARLAPQAGMHSAQLRAYCSKCSRWFGSIW